MPKSVVILSGGLDSACLLAHLVKTSEGEFYVLTFDYGSKHNEREIPFAKFIAGYYGDRVVSHRIISLPFIGEEFNSDLLKKGGEIPEGHYEDESMKRTVVPFRNGIMLSIAIGYAESVGAGKVFFGAHKGDHAIYPDCRDAFTAAMRQASILGTYNGVVVSAPFGHLSKADVLRIGVDSGVPIEFTYSCYKGGKKHCGKCGTCVERKEAFKIIGVKDPTEYEG